jgi:signal transduction histidine kinase
MNASGVRAKDLPWLSPASHSLRALARSSLARHWHELQIDPGVVILVARGSKRHGPSLVPPSELRLLSTALRHLYTARGIGFVDWELSGREAYHAALRQAQIAAALAPSVPGCDPQCAWIGGFVAALGWLARSAATDAGPAGRRDGFDAAGVGRRLAHRWGMPVDYRTIAGHLALPVDQAIRLGAEPALFQLVQIAVLLRQRELPGAEITVGAELRELLTGLELRLDQVEQIAERAAACPWPAIAWESPATQPLLIDLLELAARDRRRHNRTAIERLHGEIDLLATAVAARHGEETRRLQALKLAALAEFAAGAGHEINNPLAVISGQAQYLLRQMEMLDGPAEEIDDLAEYLANLKSVLFPSLQKIVGQTQRIHRILTDLMQYARPAAPRRRSIDVAELIRDAAETLQPLADERQVRLVASAPDAPLAIHADPGQARAALTALLRNAIEAAPPAGWAGVRTNGAGDDRLVLAVEDSGPGPGSLAQEHLFDPFFSGRSAGRGRGLGLPTAWRLARQQAGDVRFDGVQDGVTRFSLILPLCADSPVAEHANGLDRAAVAG